LKFSVKCQSPNWESFRDSNSHRSVPSSNRRN